ncbi:MAG: hypothetical protein A3A33_04125 [Candidatus Yanofskybacteria bacterium RIFCSPLOWO2_01_FULL_49_25]|uniref:Uncharacterized protein n=1 Tax=Candidatus Yanofskybacteria bacterium RIFCSPLOWO2_01_FULL_49_25 TaxID=1802701 RepID=A0A1F8GRP8_9BACT|nr:MAG: hypothetical protein A3A33_04125 [Candidatus Yanofskybacteria bacterium RIFCSPLOWO2_01_FULL_49_25]
MIKFYLNGNNQEQPIAFDLSFLPMMISGGEGSGASFFSVSVVSSLALQGLPVLFYSLKPDARTLFERQIGTRKDDSDIIMVESGNAELAQKAFAELVPRGEHILFIKNAEVTITKELLLVVEKSDKLILSGDLNASPLQKYIDEKEFATTIIMENRKGYFINNARQGIVRVEES